MSKTILTAVSKLYTERGLNHTELN